MNLKGYQKLSVSRFITEYIEIKTNPFFIKLPKLITLDAYNTIYSTKKPVLDIYVETYNSFLIDETKKLKKIHKEIMYENFPMIFKKHMLKYPNYGKLASIPASEWWCILIKLTFEQVNVFLNKEQSLEILELFKGKVYESFPDLEQLLQTVRSNSKTKIGICSNTDPLFNNIMEKLKNDNQKFVMPDKEFIFLSYDINLKKNKSGEFFKTVFNLTQKEIKDLKPDECWHIGDELENDLLGSVVSGWKGICIDRGDTYGFFSQESQSGTMSNENITLNKINKTARQIFDEGKTCKDIVLLKNGGIIVRNMFVLEEIFMALKSFNKSC
ncbi:hypothetical protein QEN19_000217 [Hanseniaspora menglaensis]